MLLLELPGGKMKRTVTVNETVVPDKLTFARQVFEIEVPEKFWIRGFKIILDDNNKIEKVIVNGSHPNADPETCELCLSDQIIGKPFSEEVISEVYSCISVYNFNNSYFRIWDQIKIKN